MFNQEVLCMKMGNILSTSKFGGHHPLWMTPLAHGCYRLVGNNTFTSISLENNLAILAPSPQDYIRFRPGDVLGFYVEKAKDADDGVVILTSGSNTSELVWHASIAPTMATSQNGDCPYSVGSSGVLNTSKRAAPVISILISNKN